MSYADRRVLHEPVRELQPSLTSILNKLTRNPQLKSSTRTHSPLMQEALCVVGVQRLEGQCMSAAVHSVAVQRRPSLENAIVRREACVQQ